MNKLEESIMGSIESLTRATANYVYKRIDNSSSKEAYKLGMEECISTLKEGWDNLDLLKMRLRNVADQVDSRYKTSILSTNSSKKSYYLLACEQVIEIVSSLETRFVTGGYDSFYNSFNTEVFSYENKSIF